MRNLCIELENHPGALAEMGEVLGRLGISIEGGGAFVANGKGLANFLFEDGTAARDALDSIGIRILLESDVVVQRLDQDKPGQLGKLLRRMAEAGVNVEAQYSDHQHQLVLVVDEIDRARSVSAAWMEEHAATRRSAELRRRSRQASSLRGTDRMDRQHGVGDGELRQLSPRPHDYRLGQALNRW